MISTMKGKDLKTKKNKTPTTSTWDVIVIGGGPAGLMAASTAGKFGAKVLLLEKNEIMGKKLLISGGGRCNMTNADPSERNLISKYGKKGNFLFTPFSMFGVAESIKFFENLGVKTKVENNYRVFPISDKSSDVLEALVRSAEKNGVIFKVGAGVKMFKNIKSEIKSVILESGEEVKAKNFILATGGKSRPETGSTGDGFRWLTELGHKVAGSNPSLVPIIVKEDWIADLAGITLENVGISVWKNNIKEVNKKGRVLFTHDGLSGPTIINTSKQISDLLEGEDYEEKPTVTVSIDFFPGVGLDILHTRILKHFDENPTKKIKNLDIPEIPTKVYEKILELLEINGEWFVNEIRRYERIAFVDMCKKFTVTVKALHGYEKAIISSGGVDLNEVDFKEMKSKLYKNLFLIGDILDFDRPSGGFSLQLCWTTGYVAGKASAKASL